MWGLPSCSKGGIGSNVKSVIGINVTWPPRVEISVFCLHCLHRAVWWGFYSLDLTFWLLARKIRFIKNKLFICWACVKVFICGHRQRKLSFHVWKERGITFPDFAPDHPVCCWHLYFGQFKVTLLLPCSNCAFFRCLGTCPFSGWGGPRGLQMGSKAGAGPQGTSSLERSVLFLF